MTKDVVSLHDKIKIWIQNWFQANITLKIVILENIQQHPIERYFFQFSNDIIIINNHVSVRVTKKTDYSSESND